MIERLPRQAGFLRGLLDRGAPKAVASEHAHGGIENAVLWLCLGRHFDKFYKYRRNVKSRFGDDGPGAHRGVIVIH